MSQDKLTDVIDGGVMWNDMTLDLHVDIGETRIVYRKQTETQGGCCGWTCRVNVVDVKMLGKGDKSLTNDQASEVQALMHIFAGETGLAFTWKTRGNGR